MPTSGGSIFAKVSVTVDGQGVRDFAVVARENMDDLRPAFEVITENLRRLERRVFDTEGEALGAAWRPLAPSTVRARQRGYGYYRGGGKEGPARRVLQWRHVLRDSLTQPGAAGSVSSMSRSLLIFGTAVPQGVYNAASRPFLRLPDVFVKTDVLPPIANYLRGQDPRAGQGQRRTRRAGRILGGGAAA